MFFTTCSRIIDLRIQPRPLGTETWRVDHKRPSSTTVIAYPDVRREKLAHGLLPYKPSLGDAWN